MRKIFIAALFLASCGVNNTHEKDNEQPADTPAVTGQFIQPEPEYTADSVMVVDDDFVFGVIEKAFTTENISTIYPNGKVLDTFSNPHVEGQTGTLYAYFDETDTVKFYKTPEKNSLIELSIRSHKLVLEDSIHVGAPYTVFNNRFNIKLTQPRLVVQNFEWGVFFTFYFDDGKLISYDFAMDID